MKEHSFENPDLKSIKGVEVFMSGKWNGDRYIEKDLDAMVANFGAVEAPLKIGHDQDQKFSSVPAVGWIERIYRKGKKLFADIKDIPALVAQAINNRAYKKISAEIIWDSLIGDKFYDRVFAGAAILGGELPAVNKLADLPLIYNKEKAECKTVYFDLNGGEIVNVVEDDKGSEGDKKINKKENKTMSEELIKRYEEQLAEAKEAVEASEAKVEEAEAKVVDAEAKAKEAEEKAEVATKENEELKAEKEAVIKENELKEIKAFAQKLVDDKKILPKMQARIVKSLEESDNATKREFALNDKETVEETARENLMKAYEALPEMNIFGAVGEGEKNHDNLDAAIKKYQSENEGVSYKDAFLAVSKDNPKLIKETPVMGISKA